MSHAEDDDYLVKPGGDKRRDDGEQEDISVVMSEVMPINSGDDEEGAWSL